MRDMARLRKANAVVAVLMMALFLFHGVGNAFSIMGVGSPTSKYLARAVTALAVGHAALGVVLTVRTMRAQREAGVSYVRLNTRFWAVRVSGLAIAAFMVLHMITFMQVGDGAYRLREFGNFQLATNVCLVLSIAVHALASMRPLTIGLGVAAPRARAFDLALVLSLLLLLMAVAFVVYFVRWSVV